MCLGIPMKIIEINGNMGYVEINNVKREIGLMLIEDPQIGDWVIVHAGFAISKLEEEEAEESLKLITMAASIED